MTRAAQARLVTALLLAGLALFVATRRPREQEPQQQSSDSPPSAPAAPAGPTPQDAIYAMLDAAREGDVAKYLDSFGGVLADALRRAASERGEAAFAQYLRESNTPVKGIAVEEPQPAAGGEVRVRVELVYADRNEAQFYYLTKPSGGERWRILRLDTSERVKTLVPYGSPADGAERGSK